MRRAPGFRLKLLLAVMLVVAAVTGAGFLVAGRTVEGTYRRIAEERFANDVGFFAALQDARLAAVKIRCRGLARSVRLIAAVEEGDAALLYKIAVDELRDVLLPAAAGPGLPAARFFRFVGSDGTVVAPPTERAGTGEVADDARWETQLAAAVRSLDPAAPQQVGYLAPMIGGAPTLREVVVTQIVDPVGERRLGALALGFPVADPGGGVAGADTIRSGIFVEGRLYSRTIPADAYAALASAVSDEIAGGGDRLVDVDGVPHRVFERALHSGSGFPPAYQVGLYSMVEALARRRELRRQVLVAGGLALVLGLVLSAVIAQGLAVPIRELAAAAGEVGRGELGVRVAVRSRDELGRLAEAFNEMVAGLALKERYRSVLDLVADREVAAQLVAGRLTLGGELRDVSVLFCDIRGFTALTETMPPAEVIELLNEHMSALTRVVHAHGGAVDKFVGDALVALFGAPRSTGDDARRAVAAAQELIAARTALNATARHRLAIGVGIASGTVVAGCMGSTDRMSYTVLGARVNLAARLCDRAAPMEILLDDETRARVRDVVETDPVAPLTLKGFRQPVVAYRVRDVALRAGVS